MEGARTKRARRRSTRFGDALSAELYGYVGRYGLRHDRLLILSRDGAKLLGQDRLVAMRGAKAGRQARPFALRFLLHPQAQAALREDGWSVDVTLPSGATLLFVADKAQPAGARLLLRRPRRPARDDPDRPPRRGGAGCSAEVVD